MWNVVDANILDIAYEKIPGTFPGKASSLMEQGVLESRRDEPGKERSHEWRWAQGGTPATQQGT